MLRKFELAASDGLPSSDALRQIGTVPLLKEVLGETGRGLREMCLFESDEPAGGDTRECVKEAARSMAEARTTAMSKLPASDLNFNRCSKIRRR
jgi:hypothetical protein